MICQLCNADKPEREFSWKIKAKGKKQLRCKPCAAAFARSYRRNNPEKIKALNERYYALNRDDCLSQKRSYYQQNREKMAERNRIKYQQMRLRPDFKARIRAYTLKSHFNLTMEQYEAMAEKQNNKCAICHKTTRGHLSVDHCHTTGRVRGLLCNPCNSFLGRINDNVEALDTIREYLLS